MRNVIFAINITLDGRCDHTKTIVERAGSAPIEGIEEILEYYAHLMRDVGKSYQLMLAFWADVAKKNH